MKLFLGSPTQFPVFKSLRYDAFAIKAGILPYYRDTYGTSHFLLAAPKPVRNPQDSPPFAIARGARRMREAAGEWLDIRSTEDAQRATSGVVEVEAAHLTALKEGQEELGLPPSAIRTLYDCGALAYKEYGIHLFLAEVAEGVPLLPARDSAAVRWMTLAQAQAMAQTGAFNPGYLPLLEAMAGCVS